MLVANKRIWISDFTVDRIVDLWSIDGFDVGSVVINGFMISLTGDEFKDLKAIWIDFIEKQANDGK